MISINWVRIHTNTSICLQCFLHHVDLGWGFFNAPTHLLRHHPAKLGRKWPDRGMCFHTVSFHLSAGKGRARTMMFWNFISQIFADIRTIKKRKEHPILGRCKFHAKQCTFQTIECHVYKRGSPSKNPYRSTNIGHQAYFRKASLVSLSKNHVPPYT